MGQKEGSDLAKNTSNLGLSAVAPRRIHMEPENIALEEEKTLSNSPFLGSNSYS